jgi:CBS domain-containing protein
VNRKEALMVNLTARDIMNQDVLTVGKDWSIDQLTEFLIENSISGAPVVSEDGLLLGVVSMTDIVRYRNIPATDNREDDLHDYYIHTSELKYTNDEIETFHLTAEALTAVKDIMTPKIFAVNADTNIRDVADTMIRGNIHRVLVTRNEALIGIITSMDMLRVIRDF